MSFFSRLLGLIFAVLPGLFFLYLSALFFTKWPQLGVVLGPLYSLVSFVTGAVCLYLGIGILFGRDRAPEPIATEQTTQLTDAQTSVVAPPIIEAQPLQAAPLPVTPLPVVPLPVAPLQAAPLPTEFVETPRAPVAANDAATPPQSAPEPIPSVEKTPVPAPPDSPEIRIRQLAKTRPQWQVTAPQLAHMANLNMAVADATAREMALNGQAQLQTGPNGETVYVFDLVD